MYNQQKMQVYPKRSNPNMDKEFNLSKLYGDTNAAPTKPNMKAFENIPVTQSGPHWTPVEPLNNFSDMSLHPALMANIRVKRYEVPTPVQKYAIKILSAQRDLMACAQTGSGKTAAFLLPIFNAILNGNFLEKENKVGDVCCPTLLVLAPTRELACQIYGESYKFSRGTSITSCVVYGGEKIHIQLNNVARGCHVLVATPGRLLALLTKNRVDLSRVKFLVFDEADRMLDMGFEPQIRRIVNEYGMPQLGHRQTLMFSATFPDEIQSLANEFMSKYVFLAVGHVGSTNENITQQVIHVNDNEKLDRLIDILRSQDQLNRRNFPVSAIHGNRDQMDRHTALTNFRSGRTPILVATGVASRGLDIPNVKHVVNFDLPYDIEEYIHRIGRTGRIGSSGIATSFFTTDKNLNVAKSLVDLLHQSKQNVPSWLSEAAKNTNYGKKGQRRFNNSIGMTNHQYGSTDHRSGHKSTSYVSADPSFMQGLAGGAASNGAGHFGHQQQAGPPHHHQQQPASLMHRYNQQQHGMPNHHPSARGPPHHAPTAYAQGHHGTGSHRWDNGVAAAAMYNQGFYSAHAAAGNQTSGGTGQPHLDTYTGVPSTATAYNGVPVSGHHPAAHHHQQPNQHQQGPQSQPQQQPPQQTQPQQQQQQQQTTQQHLALLTAKAAANSNQAAPPFALPYYASQGGGQGSVTGAGDSLSTSVSSATFYGQYYEPTNEWYATNQ